MGTQSFNGLNGTILLNTGREELTLGTVPGEPYGFKSALPVTVSIRVERLERSESYQTTEHETVSAPLEIAVTSSVWRPSRADIVTGGATVEPIREVAAAGKPSRFWDAEKLTRLADLGERWHLNAMRAGCAHQTVVWENDPRYGYRPPSLDLTTACPVSGYRYGSAWLVEPPPAEVLADVLDLLAGPIANRNVYVHPDLTR